MSTVKLVSRGKKEEWLLEPRKLSGLGEKAHRENLENLGLPSSLWCDLAGSMWKLIAYLSAIFSWCQYFLSQDESGNRGAGPRHRWKAWGGGGVEVGTEILGHHSPTLFNAWEVMGNFLRRRPWMSKDGLAARRDRQHSSQTGLSVETEGEGGDGQCGAVCKSWGAGAVARGWPPQ